MIYKSKEWRNENYSAAAICWIFAHDTWLYRTNPNSYRIRRDPSYHIT